MENISRSSCEVCGMHDFYTGGDAMGYVGFRELDDLREKVQVDTITLYAFVEREGVERIGFIKANIEGAERLMLLGARETIKKFHPVLSLRTNYYPDDPEVLERIIKAIDNRYIVVQHWRNLYAW